MNEDWIKNFIANKIHEVKRGGGSCSLVLMTLISKKYFPKGIHKQGNKKQLQGIKPSTQLDNNDVNNLVMKRGAVNRTNALDSGVIQENSTLFTKVSFKTLSSGNTTIMA